MTIKINIVDFTANNIHYTVDVKKFNGTNYSII